MGGLGFLDDAAHAPDNVGILADPPEFDHERWVRLRREQLGVDVRDGHPRGHQINMASSVAGPLSPMDEVKRVLVGDFDHFKVYNGDDDEWDYNIFITPDPPFRQILDDVVAEMSVAERTHLEERERGPGFCVECEITPDEGFQSNSYFPRPRWLNTYRTPNSPLEGQTLGVYGPWVRDHYHGGRPEIHPCEVIWWMTADTPPDVTSRFVLVLQDDSERFALPSHFDGPVPRPWAAFPRQASIAFALRPRVQNHMRFDLRVLYSGEMADMPDPGGVSVTGSFGGQPVVTVTKLFQRPGSVRMRLGPVAADPDGVHLRCFLYLGIQVGRDDDGHEGYALLNLETSAPGGTRPPSDPPVPPGGQRP
jgi:hypothetical protein